jgi:SAM-dependent methyltransferase
MSFWSFLERQIHAATRRRQSGDLEKAEAMTTPQESWDSVYTGDAPPWDIGRPQPVFAGLADRGLLSGRLLDSGCGTGEHTLLAAARGAEAVGVDLSPLAIEKARRKAADRGVTARFEVADALDLGSLGLTFDTIIDSGVFHVFDDSQRSQYVTSLGSVLRPGGHCYLVCFSDRQPGDWGPRRVSRDELAAAFSDGWVIAGLDAAQFELNPVMGVPAARAWLADLRRK